MTNEGIRIMGGLCQTSSESDKDFTIDLAKMKFTNSLGKEVHALWAARMCFIKSRTMFGEGMGVDSDAYIKYVLLAQAAIRAGEKTPQPPVTQGALWAAEVQSETGIVLGMEMMGPFQANLYKGFIECNKGHNWVPSTESLGWATLGLAEENGVNGWTFGLKNPKFYSGNPHDEQMDEMKVLANSWAGLGTYALGAIHLPKEIMLIERGVLTQKMLDYRNVPVENTALLARDLLQQQVEKLKLGNKTKITLGKDISHDNGEKRRHKIVEAGITAALKKDKDGRYVYSLILAEVMRKNGPMPKSDGKQHITDEELMNMITEIEKERPIISDR